MRYLLITVLFFAIHSLSAQVYISKLYKDVIFLGPSNVAPHHGVIASSYIYEIEDFYDVLVKGQEELNSAIRTIKDSESISKEDAYNLSKYQSEIEYIEKELTILMQIKTAWLSIIKQDGLKLEVVDLIRSGKCLEIETIQGTFGPGEYNITLDKNLEKVKVIEHIGIAQQEMVTQWEKKVNKDCISENPEDCFLWCRVDLPGGKVVHDITNDIYIFEGSKLENEYLYNHASSSASRDLVIDLEGSLTDILNLVNVNNNSLLQIKSWKEVPCK